ncbi:MAG: class I SAM-dependent methyltransferase [Erysipelotrichaceae bacterium]|nr:class I SAM-dependent methyltransferase [Erysipelotrichaceae bacterium]
MFDKRDVIRFFDALAPDWDEETGTENSEIIGLILDNALISEGEDILDVGCGTGRLFPYYLKRNVSSVTGIDISSGMIEIAKKKLSGGKTVLICDDASEHTFNRCFDRIVVFDAFPHFTDPKKTIENLSKHLKEDGTLTIAHDASRDEINRRHGVMQSDVSHVLMDIDELNEVVSKYLKVEIKISDGRMYQIVGRKEKDL